MRLMRAPAVHEEGRRSGRGGVAGKGNPPDSVLNQGRKGAHMSLGREGNSRAIGREECCPLLAPGAHR